MILGEDGQKMSKSRGNVINPDDVVREKIYENIRWGNPFSCNVTITDDLEKDHTVKIISYCRIHDPKKENQSLRVEAYTKSMADQKK